MRKMKIGMVAAKCQFCDKEVARTIVKAVVTCFDCNMSNRRKRANERNKKRREEVIP